MKDYTEEQIENMKTFRANATATVDSAFALAGRLPDKLDDKIGNALGPLVSILIEVDAEIKTCDHDYKPPAFTEGAVNKAFEVMHTLMDLLD